MTDTLLDRPGYTEGQTLRNPQLASLADEPEFGVSNVFHIDDTYIAIDMCFFYEGTIVCDRYKRTGADTFVPDGSFSGSVEFICPITISVNLESGVAEDFDSSTYSMKYGPEWSPNDLG